MLVSIKHRLGYLLSALTVLLTLTLFVPNGIHADASTDFYPS